MVASQLRLCLKGFLIVCSAVCVGGIDGLAFWSFLTRRASRAPLGLTAQGFKL